MENTSATVEVRRLTLELVSTLEAEVCSICQYPFRIREYLVGLSCGHGYRRDCFSTWIREVILLG